MSSTPAYPGPTSRATLRPEVLRERLRERVAWLNGEADRLDPARSPALRAGGGLLVIGLTLLVVPLATAWFAQALDAGRGGILPGLAWTAVLLATGPLLVTRDWAPRSVMDWAAASAVIVLASASAALAVIAGRTDIVTDAPPGYGLLTHGVFTVGMALGLLVLPGDALVEVNRLRAQRLRRQAHAAQVDLHVLDALKGR